MLLWKFYEERTISINSTFIQELCTISCDQVKLPARTISSFQLFKKILFILDNTYTNCTIVRKKKSIFNHFKYLNYTIFAFK